MTNEEMIGVVISFIDEYFRDGEFILKKFPIELGGEPKELSDVEIEDYRQRVTKFFRNAPNDISDFFADSGVARSYYLEYGQSIFLDDDMPPWKPLYGDEKIDENYYREKLGFNKKRDEAYEELDRRFSN